MTMVSDWINMLKRACSFFLFILPKAFFTGLLSWSFYVLLFRASSIIANHYHNGALAFLVGAISVILYGLSMFTYYKVIQAGAGSPLDFQELRIHDIDEHTNQHFNSANPYDIDNEQRTGLLDHSEAHKKPAPPLHLVSFYTTKVNQSYRYCKKCSVWKPDRCHHCSSCNKCILRMDHHCPWFSICIGVRNHRFFMQYLFYLTLYCLFAFITSLSVLWSLFNGTDPEGADLFSINLIVLFILGLAFSLVLFCFSVFSFYMLSKNTTTLEFQESKSNYRGSSTFNYEFDNNAKERKLVNIFDLGYKKNISGIMGTTWISWLLPINLNTKAKSATYSDGLKYEINEDAYKKVCEHAELQEQLNNQLSDYKRRLRMERENMV